MKTFVILSDLETSIMPIIISLAKKEEDFNLILLSDSVFLLNDSSDNFFKTLKSQGAKIYAIQEDIEKRNVLADVQKDLKIINYNILVETLLSEPIKIINF